MKIVSDIKMYANGSFKKTIATILFNPCFHSIVLYRMAHCFYRIHLSIIAKVIWYFNRVVFNVDIDYRAHIAGGFKLVHGLGTVIGKDVKTLGRVTVYQGVTLGGSGKTRVYENQVIDQPVIEDNVIIYTDAKVFGPVIIGANNHIKAGAIISEDVLPRECV